MRQPSGNLLGGLILAALACFGLGGLTGWILRAPEPPGPSILSRLTEDLDLSPEQVAAVDAILTEDDRELDVLVSRHRESMQDEVAARLDASEQSILALLDESQRSHYETLLAVEGR
jgi:hypothetical protein